MEKARTFPMIAKFLLKSSHKNINFGKDLLDFIGISYLQNSCYIIFILLKSSHKNINFGKDLLDFIGISYLQNSCYTSYSCSTSCSTLFIVLKEKWSYLIQTVMVLVKKVQVIN